MLEANGGRVDKYLNEKGKTLKFFRENILWYFIKKVHIVLAIKSKHEETQVISNEKVFIFQRQYKMKQTRKYKHTQFDAEKNPQL